jgi:hypothetical protein
LVIRLLVTLIGATLIAVTLIAVIRSVVTQSAAILTVATLSVAIQNAATLNVLVVPSAALAVTRGVRTLARTVEQEQVATPNAVALSVALDAIRAVPILVQTVAPHEVQTVGSNAQAQSAVQAVTPGEALHEVPQQVPQVLQCVARA